VLRWLYQQKPSVGTLSGVVASSLHRTYSVKNSFATFTELSWLVDGLVDRSALPADGVLIATERDRWANLERKGEREDMLKQEQQLFSTTLKYDQIVQQRSDMSDDDAYSMLWQPFEAVSLTKLRQQFDMDEENEHLYPVLFCFLDQRAAQHLSAVSHLPVILEWHKLLRETYPAGTLSQEDDDICEKKLQDVIVDNEKAEHNKSKRKAHRQKEKLMLQKGLNEYIKSFNAVFPLVKNFECHENPYCNSFKMTPDAKLNYSLPIGEQNSDGEVRFGFFTVAICQHLASLHNQLLAHTKAADGVEVKFSDPVSLIRRNVIDYEESRDLLPLLYTFSGRSQEGGEERRKYDLEEIDAALRRSLLEGKSPIITQGEEGKVPDFKFKVDTVTVGKQPADMKEPVDEGDMKQIRKDLEMHQERIKRLVDVLKDGFNYLLSLEVDAYVSMKLNEFMRRMWKGESSYELKWTVWEEDAPSILREKMMVNQLSALLEELLKSTGAKTDPVKLLQERAGWEEKLTKEDAAEMLHFEQDVRRENKVQPFILGLILLPVMRSFMLEHAADVNQRGSLGQFLEYVDAPSGDCLNEELDWFADAFPPSLTVSACYAAYRSLERLQRKLEPITAEDTPQLVEEEPESSSRDSEEDEDDYYFYGNEEEEENIFDSEGEEEWANDNETRAEEDPEQQQEQEQEREEDEDDEDEDEEDEEDEEGEEKQEQEEGVKNEDAKEQEGGYSSEAADEVAQLGNGSTANSSVADDIIVHQNYREAFFKKSTQCLQTELDRLEAESGLEISIPSGPLGINMGCTQRGDFAMCFTGFTEERIEMNTGVQRQNEIAGRIRMNMLVTHLNGQSVRGMAHNVLKDKLEQTRPCRIGFCGDEWIARVEDMKARLRNRRGYEATFTALLEGELEIKAVGIFVDEWVGVQCTYNLTNGMFTYLNEKRRDIAAGAMANSIIVDIPEQHQYSPMIPFGETQMIKRHRTFRFDVRIKSGFVISLAANTKEEKQRWIDLMEGEAILVMIRMSY
jgi:hypothetical protein